MDLQELANRICMVVKEFRDGPELTPETVNLRHIAEMAWALDCEPHLALVRLPPKEGERTETAQEQPTPTETNVNEQGT